MGWVEYVDKTIGTSAAEQVISVYDKGVIVSHDFKADVSNITNGTTLVFKIYQSLDGSKWLLYDKREIKDAQEAPLFDTPIINAKYLRITVQRTTGSDISIRCVHWYLE